MKTHHHAASFCPSCHARLSASAGSTSGPRPGDYSVCAYCQKVLRYNSDLTVRAVSAEEFNKLPAGDRLQLMKAQEMARRASNAS